MSTLKFFLLALAVLTAGALGAARPAQAQLRVTDLKFYGAGQGVVPLSSSGFRAGPGLGAGLSVQITEKTDFRVFGSYSRLGLTGSAERGDGALFMRSLDLGLLREIKSGEHLQVYLAGTFGLDDCAYRMFSGGSGSGGEPARVTETRPEEGTAFSVAGGLGLRFPLSYTSAFFVEPAYRVAFTAGDATHYAPIRLGFVFGEF